MAKAKAFQENHERESTRAFFQCLFIALWMASLASALAVVYSTFKTRESVRTLESLRSSAIELKVVSGKYQLEKSTLGAYARIESIAKSDLSMLSPSADQTVLVVRE